jgi:hypothetical protein
MIMEVIYSLMLALVEEVWLSKEKECSAIIMVESTMISPLKSKTLLRKLMLRTKKGRRVYMLNK